MISTISREDRLRRSQQQFSIIYNQREIIFI